MNEPPPLVIPKGTIIPGTVLNFVSEGILGEGPARCVTIWWTGKPGDIKDPREVISGDISGRHR